MVLTISLEAVDGVKTVAGTTVNDVGMIDREAREEIAPMIVLEVTMGKGDAIMIGVITIEETLGGMIEAPIAGTMTAR